MISWADVLPEVDPSGDLGIWVAALGEPAAVEARRSRETVTVAGSASGRALRLTLPVHGPRPTTAAGGACAVVFDGVLFNRSEFQSQLQDGTVALRDDASLILQGYLRWGRDLIPRLKGIFALMLWDTRDDSLVCVRDRTGVYPLFYADAGSTFLVSTSVQALLRYPGVEGTLDRGALAGHLIHHWVGPEETYFRAVKRLSAGCFMEIRGGVRRARRYWDPVAGDVPPDGMREEELERFDALLSAAVRRCLQLGRTGIYLSGGIDSVGVAVAAADACRANGWPMPIALTLDLSEFGVDETAMQKAVTKALMLPQVGARYTELVDPQTALDDALGWSSVLPWPIPNLVILPYINFGPRARAEGCRVVLTGEGGDELLAVHPHYGADLLRAGNLVGLARFFRIAWRSHPLSLWGLSRVYGWNYGLRPVLSRAGGRLLVAYAPNRLRAHRRAAILAPAPDWLAPDPAVQRALEDRIALQIERNLATPEPPGIYRATIRGFLEVSFETDFERSRRTGVRLLHPYWDADVVEFVLRAHPMLLSIGGRTKGLVRRRIAHRLPGLGFETQRKVMLPNIERTLLLSRARAVWEKQRGAPTLAMLGVVDETRLARAIEQFFTETQPATSRLHPIWASMNLEAWARTRVA